MRSISLVTKVDLSAYQSVMQLRELMYCGELDVVLPLGHSLRTDGVFETSHLLPEFLQAGSPPHAE